MSSALTSVHGLSESVESFQADYLGMVANDYSITAKDVVRMSTLATGEFKQFQVFDAGKYVAPVTHTAAGFPEFRQTTKDNRVRQASWHSMLTQIDVLADIDRQSSGYFDTADLPLRNLSLDTFFDCESSVKIALFFRKFPDIPRLLLESIAPIRKFFPNRKVHLTFVEPVDDMDEGYLNAEIEVFGDEDLIFQRLSEFDDGYWAKAAGLNVARVNFTVRV